MTDEQLMDAITCCHPQEAWEAMLANLKLRAKRENEIAKDLEAQVRDLAEQAEQHWQRALEFGHLAEAMMRAPVTFAPIETRQGGDAKQGSVAKP